MNDFKYTLYEAVLVAFGKTLAKYDAFTQGVMMRDIGREIIDYLNSHGFGFKETGSMDDLNQLIELFVKNGFADSLEVTPAEKGDNYLWTNLYGGAAYKELYDLSLNPFLSCPLNLCMYYVAGKHKKKLVMHRKTFLNERQTEAQYEIVDDETPEGNLDQLVIDSARMFELAYERQMLFQRQVNTDYLTGAHSRQSLMEKGEKLLHFSRIDQKPFSVLMLDVDHFKRINDTYGHGSGDLAARTLVSICQKSVRETDLVGRLGGDEFAILLPNAPQKKAVEIAERLRREVKEAVIDNGNGNRFQITISVGVACHDGADETFQSILDKADAALLRAKRSGRNATVVYNAGER